VCPQVQVTAVWHARVSPCVARAAELQAHFAELATLRSAAATCMPHSRGVQARWTQLKHLIGLVELGVDELGVVRRQAGHATAPRQACEARTGPHTRAVSPLHKLKQASLLAPNTLRTGNRCGTAWVQKPGSRAPAFQPQRTLGEELLELLLRGHGGRGLARKGVDVVNGVPKPALREPRNQQPRGLGTLPRGGLCSMYGKLDRPTPITRAGHDRQQGDSRCEV
jgi:hypothetical protein